MHALPLLTAGLAISGAALATPAAVTLPALFADGMVLQRDKPVAVWGKADPAERVTVAIAGQQRVATADANGRWRVTLEPIVATPAPLELRIVSNSGEPRTIRDVLLGEVWICSGQSNMEFPVRNSATSREAAAAPPNPKLRLFRVDKQALDVPRDDCVGQWQTADAQTIAPFSAVGFAFAARLQQELGVPVGIIQASWGGTPAEAWTSRAAIESTPALTEILARAKRMAAQAIDAQPKWEVTQAKWKTDVDAATAAGRKPPAAPRRPSVLQKEKYPFVLFNGMVAPIAGYGARGVIWYQGEANAKRPAQYRTLLPAMIGSWRDAWGDPALPFGLVQLPDFGPPSDSAVEDDFWPAQRESQAKIAAATPGVDYVTTLGFGEAGDIHPKRKREVGERLAAWALGRCYGRADAAWAGPRFRSMGVDGNSIRLTFDHERPLAAEGELRGFAIAGEDRSFVVATARLDGADCVVVTAPTVARPVAVRYAWKNSPVATLRDASSVPASPFRTDDWPLIVDAGD